MGDAAAANEKGGLDLGQVPPQASQVDGQVLGGAGDEQLVTGPGHEAAVGDDDLPLPLCGGEEDGQGAGPAEQVGQGMAHDGVLLPDADADHLHLTPEEGVHVGCRRQAEQAGDLQGGGVLGVDHRVNGQVLLQGGQVLGIGHVPNPGDGVLGAQPLGGEGTEHVDLVHVGGGQDQVCLFGPGFPQDGGGRARPFDAHDV